MTDEPTAGPEVPPRKFCVFVLSHGRAGRVRTIDSLRAGGYTGTWYVVVDNEDATVQDYVARYGRDRVIVFDKLAVSRTFDTADLSEDRRAVVFARNACFDIARDLGMTHFLELDDDYQKLEQRYGENGKLMYAYAKDLDAAFAAMLDFLDTSGAASVAFGQGGDLVGGLGSRRWEAKVLRKAMNTFFCRTDSDWRFVGRVNEDVNTYTTLSHRGRLFFTTLYATVKQGVTQANPGGMTDLYRTDGTYAKSFYPVMMCPSAVKVSMLSSSHARIHHKIDWNACAPKIVPESWRKWTPPPMSADSPHVTR